MTSVADPIAGHPHADASSHVSASRASTRADAVSFPVAGTERELRLDLFRGLALWLIFIDHLPPNILTWLTIRNYGFSDATEIFIFISGYTAAFVYGRAMQEQGTLVASARIFKRVWQIYVAHVFLFTIFLAEISYVATRFENPLYSEEMGILDFLKQPDVTIVQALLLKFRPVNMDVLPLYIVLMLFLPPILWLMRRRADLTLALSVGLYALTWEFDLHLTAYPNGVWAFNPFAWQLLFVFGAWCALGGAVRDVADTVIQHHALALRGLSSGGVLGDADLVHSADPPSAAEGHRAVDVSHQQDRSRRAALRPLPGAGGAHGPFPAQGVAGAEIGLAAADGAVRPALARNLLYRGVPGLCRPFRAG